jgi:hypothetical protein
MRRRLPRRSFIAGCLVGIALVAVAVQPLAQAPPPGTGYPDSLFATLKWRSIGPNRGGRSIAVAGSTARPHEYYFGATGGGVWKTSDGGTTWRPVADQFLKTSSVGALAVAESNPDIVYVGMGETQLRGNVIQGDGVYKSIDGGKTWTHVGLSDTQTIARILTSSTSRRSGNRTRRARTGGSSARRTAAAPGNGSCSTIRSPVRSTCRWIRTIPTCCTPPCGRSSGRRIPCRAAVQAAACSSPQTAGRHGWS